MKSTMRLVENEVTINAPWGKIAALTWGDPANPPVVLCHGKLDVSSGFRPLVSLLPTTLFYVSVDLPGNGKSDYFPTGSRFTAVDFVPTILKIKEHFKWDKFVYIGHSLGVIIGKYFNIAYPGVITRMVELDPVPAHEVWEANAFASWYHLFYGDFYKDDKYRKSNASSETAPKYTYEKVMNCTMFGKYLPNCLKDHTYYNTIDLVDQPSTLYAYYSQMAMQLMMNTRGLTKEAAAHVLERSLAPAGDGLYRLTYDQRLKEIPRMPWGRRQMQELYTSVSTPTLAILSKSILELGAYHYVPFAKDPKVWPNGNYRVKTVAGGHDVHINNPERLAPDVAEFLLQDFQKAKL